MESSKLSKSGKSSLPKILGLPFWLYLVVLVLVIAITALDCLPANMVGAFLFLMVLGEGMGTLGNTVPVVKTYLGGSVICIFGGALMTLWGLVPENAMALMDEFVNRQGFLILYISALITGSLFSIDKNLLLRASVKLLPLAVFCLIVGGLCCGLLGVFFGNGFWDNILYVLMPMTSGGMTAGTVPLSSIYATQLGLDASDILTRMAPATVLGNCIAIVVAGLLNNAGTKHPSWTGNGQLVNDGRPVKKSIPSPASVAKLCTGLVISLAFYALGQLLNRFVPIIPIYAWMIIAVVVVKCIGILPEPIEDAARQWGTFAIHGWTNAALVGIGITLIDLATIAKNMTPAFLITVVVVELVIIATAAFAGKLIGFFPVEAAISAGMCTTNMGGSGNVAVLSSAHRMELLPFAQIVTRSCGALMLTLGGILVRLVG